MLFALEIICQIVRNYFILFIFRRALRMAFTVFFSNRLLLFSGRPMFLPLRRVPSICLTLNSRSILLLVRLEILLLHDVLLFWWWSMLCYRLISYHLIRLLCQYGGRPRMIQVGCVLHTLTLPLSPDLIRWDLRIISHIRLSLKRRKIRKRRKRRLYLKSRLALKIMLSYPKFLSWVTCPHLQQNYCDYSDEARVNCSDSKTLTNNKTKLKNNMNFSNF